MKIYITACDKRLNYAKKIKEMLKDCPYEYFFVYGKGNTKKLEPYLEFDFEDSYENLTEKTFYLVDHFYKTFTDDKLLKMNDDTFLDIEKIKKYESCKEDYIGFFHSPIPNEYAKIFHWYKIENPEYKVFKNDITTTYADGSMYIINRNACKKILNCGIDFFKVTPTEYFGEDVKVGLALQDKSIIKKDIKYPAIALYEITEDFMSIHPTNVLMFDKLKIAKTNDEKMKILNQYNFINENLLRIQYLDKIKTMVKSN